MRVEFLGTAAGGGFPQWNCGCPNCAAVRRGSFTAKARSQLQIAVSRDDHVWVLLNASPDLHIQIESNQFLHPRNGMRSSPIAGVILTSADLDQTLGLLSLREFQPIQVFATDSVRRILVEDNSMFSMLNRMPRQATWRAICPGVCFQCPAEESPTIGFLPIPIASSFPSYVAATRAAMMNAGESTLGLILKAESGRTLGYFPAVGRVDEQLLRRLDRLDVLLFDGTFWRDTELIDVYGGAPTAREMGHIPVSSESGSLALFSNIRCGRKIFVHINNTNPMLDESGPEYRQVRDAGWEIAEDGWHLEL
jgi:pyrroloquinoline quinone biosynthesis protein B